MRAYMPAPTSVPLEPATRWSIGHYIGLGLLALFGLPLVIAIAANLAHDTDAGTPKPPTAKTDKPDDSIPAYGMEFMAKRLIAPHLRDPSSAQFQNVSYRTRRTVPVLCGEVNSRNGFGGLTGFQRFVMTGPIVVLREEVSPAKFGKLWNSACAMTDAEDKDWPAMKAALIKEGKLPAS